MPTSWHVSCLYLLLCTSAATSASVDQYNVTWTSLLPEPGKSTDGLATYANSMPIGNGRVNANVNYESASDQIAFLISSSSSWSEDGEAMKVAVLTVQLPSRDGAELGDAFSQVFNPQDATVRFAIPAGGQAPALEVVSYVDATSDSIVVSVSPPIANISASFEPIRAQAQQQTPPFDCHEYTVSADVVSADGSAVYHRNTYSSNATFMANTLQSENIPLVDDFNDPLLNRTTGALVAPVLPDDPGASTFAITVLTMQTTTIEEYESSLTSASKSFIAQQQAGEFPPSSHLQFWSNKWQNHYIKVSANGDSSTFNEADANTVSQMYVLQRFIEISQARQPGTHIKFNGMLYSANRIPNSDKNQWGGLSWWQNLRMPYYNMLTAGDTEELLTLLIAFNRTVPIAQERTRAYFGFDGIWWPEYTSVFYGTTHPTSFRSGSGCSPAVPGEPVWHSDDPWNGYNRQGSLDLSLLILDYFAYSGSDEVATSLLQIPYGVVEFYNNLWGNTSIAGEPMVFFPTQVVETWQCPGWPVDPTDCPTNDMPTIAGLHAVIEKLLNLPPAVASDAQKTEWAAIQDKLPALPVADSRYVPCPNCNKSAPAGTPGSHRTSNVENGELYVVSRL